MTVRTDDRAPQRRRTAQAEARSARAAARAAARAVPPQRSAELAHLTLGDLRTYRSALAAEEDRVSYWRRILQARLDVLRAVENVRAADPAALQPVLAGERVGRGRLALVRVVPADDIPPLPDLERLWSQPTPADAEQRGALEAELERAEEELSTYRSALHRRIGVATQEMIARYRETPTDCLSALPLR